MLDEARLEYLKANLSTDRDIIKVLREQWLKQGHRKECDSLDEVGLRLFAENLVRGHQVSVKFDGVGQLELRPDWLDEEKMKKGQKFAQDFYVSVCSSEVSALILILSQDFGLRKLVWTGKSSTRYTSFKRYLSTGGRVRSWFKGDLLDNESEASKNLSSVNAMHRAFGKSISASSIDEFTTKTELPNAKPSICPFVAKDMANFESLVDADFVEGGNLILSQTDMTITQFSFVGLLILKPECFGVCPKKYAECLDGFVHLWRYIGYRLGVLDEYNICTGSYNKVKEKCRLVLDLLVKPSMKNVSSKWEHMSRCIIEGVNYYAEGFSFEEHLLFIFHVLGLDYTNIYAKSSVLCRVRFTIMKHLFYYVIPLKYIRLLLTERLLNKVETAASNIPTEEEFNKKRN